MQEPPISTLEFLFQLESPSALIDHFRSMYEHRVPPGSYYKLPVSKRSRTNFEARINLDMKVWAVSP
jgi:hypothetical protein